LLGGSSASWAWNLPLWGTLLFQKPKIDPICARRQVLPIDASPVHWRRVHGACPRHVWIYGRPRRWAYLFLFLSQFFLCCKKSGNSIVGLYFVFGQNCMNIQMNIHHKAQPVASEAIGPCGMHSLLLRNRPAGHVLTRDNWRMINCCNEWGQRLKLAAVCCSIRMLSKPFECIKVLNVKIMFTEASRLVAFC